MLGQMAILYFCQTLDGVGLMMIVLNITDANAVLVIMELMNLAGTRPKLKCWGFSRGKRIIFMLATMFAVVLASRSVRCSSSRVR